MTVLHVKKMATKPQNNSGVLVAIAKIETKLDILTVDVKDLKDGMKSDIENLKIDKISRGDAISMQNEMLGKQVDLEADVKELKKDVVSLQDSRISYRASLKVWVLLGGGIWSIATILLSVWLTTKI